MHNCYSARHCFVQNGGGLVAIVVAVYGINCSTAIAVIDSVRFWMTNDAQLLLC